MKIGIDCRMWDETGIGRYIRNIVRELSELDKNNEYVLFLLSKDFGEARNLNLPNNFKLIEANIRWHTFSEQVILPFVFFRENLDLLHVPHFNIPLIYFRKFVTTIHDLTILRVKTGRATTLPYSVYLLKHLAFRLNMFSTIKRAKVIFTVSEFVKRDIMKTYGVDDKRILLTPNAVSESFLSGVENGHDSSAVLEKYNIRKPYIFYIGNAHPHKNISRLIQTFEIVIRKKPELNLVLGGSKKFFYERLEREWSNSEISNKINFTGFIDDKDLPTIYKEAELFVNPSLYEGFGIQLLEAFACGTKVVCSNTTSLPEIGENIPFYFNPNDVDEMVSVVEDALGEKIDERVQKGYERVKDFSWRRSAEVILEAYGISKPV